MPSTPFPISQCLSLLLYSDIANDRLREEVEKQIAFIFVVFTVLPTLIDVDVQKYRKMLKELICVYFDYLINQQLFNHHRALSLEF